jgi:hypothetical protein
MDGKPRQVWPGRSKERRIPMSTLMTEEHVGHEPEVRERGKREPERMPRREFGPEEKSHFDYLTAGSIVEGLGGAAAVALGILALAGVLPMYLGPIAILAIAGTLLFTGWSLMSRYATVLHEFGHQIGDVVGGITVEFLAGLAGIALGVLSLVGVIPFLLAPIAVIVFGTAVVFSGAATYRLYNLSRAESQTGTTPHWIIREGVLAGVAAEAMLGLGAIVLGILGVIGLSPWILTLVGVLGVGSSIMLGCSALAGKVWKLLGC